MDNERLKLIGLVVAAAVLIALKPALAAGIFLFGVVVGPARGWAHVLR